MTVWPVAYMLGKRYLAAYISSQVALRSVEHGVCAETGMALVSYVWFSGPITQEYLKLNELAKAGLSMLELRYGTLLFLPIPFLALATLRGVKRIVCAEMGIALVSHVQFSGSITHEYLIRNEAYLIKITISHLSPSLSSCHPPQSGTPVCAAMSAAVLLRLVQLSYVAFSSPTWS
jgi:hypothetical protein